MTESQMIVRIVKVLRTELFIGINQSIRVAEEIVKELKKVDKFTETSDGQQA